MHRHVFVDCHLVTVADVVLSVTGSRRRLLTELICRTVAAVLLQSQTWTSRSLHSLICQYNRKY